MQVVIAMLLSQCVEVGSTATCLSCHDGLRASNATVGHPVEVEWRGEKLPDALQLSDAGMITCMTCHAAGSPGLYRLSLPLKGNALCVACHTTFK